MNEEIRRLIEQGLHEENLRKLAQLCRERRTEAPAVYGTLTYMFGSFAEEYDHQGIDADRYELILATIKEPILLLLEVEDDPAVVFDRLNAVFRAFVTLKG
jgi:hypothetical protein